jgi:hypothetical protein
MELGSDLHALHDFWILRLLWSSRFSTKKIRCPNLPTPPPKDFPVLSQGDQPLCADHRRGCHVKISPPARFSEKLDPSFGPGLLPATEAGYFPVGSKTGATRWLKSTS